MSIKRGYQRAGFTLVELVVVITVIGILIAILIPAVQMVRETGRRAHCQNSVKQIALALQTYHELHRTFPPAGVRKRIRLGRRRRVRRMHGWAPFVLPHVGQQNLYDDYLWDRSWDDKRNQPVVATHISLWRCPSAPDAQNRTDLLSKGKRAAAGDYTPVTGVSPLLVRIGVVPGPYRTKKAVMRANGSAAMKQVLDGLSQTLLIVEDAGRPQHWVRGNAGPMTLNPGGGNLRVKNGRVRGAGWADPMCNAPLHSFTEDGLRVPGPCPINCTNNNEAYSFHIGGVSAAMADGRVRYLNENIGLDIYAAMITRAGGESFDD